jgi:hypothetical protein
VLELVRTLVDVGEGVATEEGVGAGEVAGVRATQSTPLFQRSESFLNTQKYFFPASIFVIPKDGHAVPGTIFWAEKAIEGTSVRRRASTSPLERFPFDGITKV